MKPNGVSRAILLADLAWSVVAFLGANAIRYGAFWKAADRSSIYGLLPFLTVTIIVWILLSIWMKLDCFRGGWHFPAIFARLFLAAFCLMCVLLSGGYLAREYVSRLALTYFGVLLFSGFVGVRYVGRLLLLARYRAGKVRRVVIVGANRIARELALKIKRHPEMMCDVVGFLCPEDDTNLSCQEAATVPTLGVMDLLAGHQISDLILALPGPSLPEILNLVARCREQGINVSFVPQPYELYLFRPALLDLDGIPVLELREVFASDFFFRFKRLVDVVFASAMSVVALPILLPAVIGLRWSKGRAFRWETRCGPARQVVLHASAQCGTPQGYDQIRASAGEHEHHRIASALECPTRRDELGWTATGIFRPSAALLGMAAKTAQYQAGNDGSCASTGPARPEFL